MDSLDDLFIILDEIDEMDQELISDSIEDEPCEIKIEYHLIHHAEGVELYRDKDYTRNCSSFVTIK